MLKGKLYKQYEIKIIETFRFEGETDPADEAIIYVNESNGGVVGYSLDTYGIYSNYFQEGYADLIHNMLQRKA